MDIGNGCTLNGFEDYEVTTLPTKLDRRRFRTPDGNDSINEIIEKSLIDADLTILAGVALKKKHEISRRRRRLISPILDVAVAKDESAVVLVEGKGGVFSWVYPEEGGDRNARRGDHLQHLKFTLGAIDVERRRRPGQRSIGGWIASHALEPVKAYVLKFIVETSLDIAISSLEGDINIGPVILEKADEFTWRRRDDYRFSDDRPARILLFVHGTFSSTEGSFGALAATPMGHLFLRMVRQQYDLVLGFDHKTLSHDPKQNASQILEAFQSMQVPKNSIIDALAYSRGGLVYRQLAEVLLPKKRPDIKLDKAVFVACTNAGTNMAEPEHWDVMLDLYTNIMLAGVRTVAVLGGAPTAAIVGEGIKLLGRFAKLIPQTVIDQGYVPGLAAMEPDGELIRILNTGNPDLDRLASYYAVTSDFDADFDSELTIKGLSKELLEFLLDRVSNRLFQEDNDLVVHTRSMTTFGAAQAKLVPDRQLDFGSSDDIYHTVYFSNKSLIKRLINWLFLEREPVLESMAMHSVAHESRIPLAKESIAIPRGVDEGLKKADSEPEISRRTTRDESSEPVEEEGRGRLLMDLSGAGAGTGVDAGRDLDDEALRDAPPFGVEEGGIEATESEKDSVYKERGVVQSDAGELGHVEDSLGFEISDSIMAVEDEIEDDEIEECFFAAEMQPYPEINKSIALFVTISSDEITVEDHSAAVASEGVKVEHDKDLEIEVIALSNCEVVGQAKRSNIKVPHHDQKIIKFLIRSEHAGQAELLVEARQGARNLVSLKLTPIFIDSSMDKLKAIQWFSMPRRGPHSPAILRIYELYSVSGKLKLRFDLSCEDPNIHVMTIKDFPASFDTSAFVATILDDIENAYNLHSDHYDSFKEDLKNKGTIWADDLLPEEVRKALWQYREDIVAIQVISEESQIPWELLYLDDSQSEEDDIDKGFLSEWGLVRWLHNAPWPSYQLRKQHVHYVIPNYKLPRYKLIGAQQEKRMLESLFPSAEKVKSRSLDVIKFLNNSKNSCDILHFACHGEVKQRAVLQADLVMQASKGDGGKTNLDLLTIESVKAKTRFSISDGVGPLVFLNACQVGKGGNGIAGVSGFADSFLRPRKGKGASAFIGALWSVNDKLALNFAEAFYKSLLQNNTLVEAIKSAREASQQKNDFTWLSYSVYGNPFAKIK